MGALLCYCFGDHPKQFQERPACRRAFSFIARESSQVEYYFPCVASCTTRKAIWFTSSLGVRLHGFRFGVDFGFFGMRPLRHVRFPIKPQENSN
jgi:hypothetical protein